MKKIISILLSVIIAISMFAVSASAEVEVSQAEKFFADLAETKSLGIKYKTAMMLASGIFLDSADKQIKIYETEDGTYDYKHKLSGELIFLNIGISPNAVWLEADDKSVLWLPSIVMKIDLEYLLDEKVDTSYDINENSDINNILFHSALDCLEFVSSRNENLSEHGEIRVETMKYSPYKLLETSVEKGTVIVPAGIDIYSLSEDEVYAYIDTNSSDAESLKSSIDSTTVDVYIEDGKIYNIIFNTIDDEGNSESSDLVPGLFSVYAEYIYTNIDDNNFKAPVFLFDWTFFIKWLLNLILM